MNHDASNTNLPAKNLSSPQDMNNAIIYMYVIWLKR